MSRIRIRDLAARHGLDAKALLRLLQLEGYRARTVLAAIDEDKGEEFIRVRGMGDGRAAQRPGQASKEPHPLKIRKYENRRLYSSEHPRHLTLDEVADQVRSGRPIQVIDASDERDLTSEVLMQILIETGRAPEIPATFLEQLIRLQDQALRGEAARWMTQVFEIYARTGREVARAYARILPTAGLAAGPLSLFWPFSVRTPNDIEQKLHDALVRVAELESQLNQAKAVASPVREREATKINKQKN